MSTINSILGRHTFSWETISWGSWLRAKLQSPAPQLIDQLKSFQMGDISEPPLENYWKDRTVLHEAVAYAAKNSDVTLQKTLDQKGEEVTSEALKSVVSFALLEEGRSKMLDVCQRLVSLPRLKEIFKVKNPTELAKSEKPVIPPPVQTPPARSFSFSFDWNRRAGVLTKVAQFLIATVALSYSLNLEEPPKTRWAAQSQWGFFRSTLQDLTWLGKTFVEWFPTPKKAALVAAGIFATLGALTYLCHRFNLGIPEVFNKKLYRNLSELARKKLLNPTMGRAREKERLKTCICSLLGQPSPLAFLVGPPGAGKSQVIEGLTLAIEEGRIPALKGYTVVSVNMADLLDLGNFSESGYTSRLDDFLLDIEGKKIIPFFDEAHNANQTGNHVEGPLIEKLKTKLLEKNIKGILATTEKEFDDHIDKNKAILDRSLRIDIPPLDDEETRAILMRQSQSYGFPVTPEAIAQIITTSTTHPDRKNRANPRNALQILQLGHNKIHGWTPEKLHKKLDDLEKEKDPRIALCRAAKEENPNWLSTPEGLKKQTELTTTLENITTTVSKIAEQKLLFQKIFDLKKIKTTYQAREYEAIHFLASDQGKNNPQMEKTYLFTKYVILPQLRHEITSLSALFKKEFKEEIPHKLTADIIKEIFPC